MVVHADWRRLTVLMPIGPSPPVRVLSAVILQSKQWAGCAAGSNRHSAWPAAAGRKGKMILVSEPAPRQRLARPVPCGQ